MPAKKAFVSTSSFAAYDPRPLQILKDAGWDYRLNPHGRKLKEEECLEFYQEVDGIIAGTELLTDKVLISAKKLKIISRCGIGLDNIDMNCASALGIRVYNTPEGPVNAVAELTIGLILDVLRRISKQDRLIRNGVWKKYMGNLFSGKVLGIMGLGRIAKRVVELSAPFNLKYVAWDNCPDREFGCRYNVHFMDFQEVLRNADILSIHLPYADELNHLIGEKELLLMKNSACLVNAARGGLVDEAALAKALKEKRIAGAALDVFEEEPYNGPLKALDNVVLTPHVGSYARESRIEMEIQAVKNLLEGFEVEKS